MLLCGVIKQTKVGKRGVGQMSTIDSLLKLETELRISIRSVETYLQQPNLSVGERAELRGRLQAHTNSLGKVKTIICQELRRGTTCNFEAALSHIEDAAKLMELTPAKGYKAEYCKGHALRKLLKSEGALQAVIAFWHASSSTTAETKKEPPPSH